MKTAAWVIVALLVGMALGSWGLKADLRKAKQQVSTLEQQVQNSSRKKTQFDGISTMLNLQQAQKGAASEEVRGRDFGRSGSSTNAEADVPHHGHSPWGPRHQRGTNAPPARRMRQDIEAAASLWKTRSELARDGFLSVATSNEQEETDFDVLMAAMNLRLSNSVRTWVDFVKTNQVFTPECSVRMMNDFSDVMVQAYTDMDRVLPEWREKTDGKFNTMDFVDPTVILPLAEIEDALSAPAWDRSDLNTNVPTGGI